MVLFLVFSQAARILQEKKRPSLPASVMIWSFIALVILTAVLLFTSAFFDRPLPFRTYLIRQLGAETGATDADAPKPSPTFVLQLPAEVLKIVESNADKDEIRAELKAWAVHQGYSLEQVVNAARDWAVEVIAARTNALAQARAYFVRGRLDQIIPPVQPQADERTVQSRGMVVMMMRILPGNFFMGSPESEGGRASDEGPQTKVTISYEFWIGKYEVTQAQWEALRNSTGLLIANPSMINGQHPSDWNLPDYGRNPERPVENIKWLEADAFCRVLTQVERTNLPAKYVYRLPTEAEWEYACRAGTTTRFSFGDDESELGKYAWFKSNAIDRTQPVGRTRPNPWGLYDMHGNVMEWCYDWYSEKLPGGAVTNPVGPDSGKKRVLRGGGWESDKSREFRCADRYGLEPTKKGWAYGFRVVLGPSIDSLRQSR
jgi:formylglycine-generating enzyme required for sulfatase activity